MSLYDYLIQLRALKFWRKEEISGCVFIMLTKCDGITFIQRTMLDILHCAVKQQQQSSSPYTLNLTCTHSFHRETHLRNPYSDGSGPGPDHKSWERIQFKEHTLIHSLSSLSIMFSMVFLYHQCKLLLGNNKKKEGPKNTSADVLLPWILNRARDSHFNLVK